MKLFFQCIGLPIKTMFFSGLFQPVLCIANAFQYFTCLIISPLLTYIDFTLSVSGIGFPIVWFSFNFNLNWKTIAYFGFNYWPQ
ncbi:hypothetical protein P872_19980 [Rhodonellum psychrophilum GCM71 = DSM 17998]|uniref:Uncharacterized protein n=1 Tax=Rhodonellum psychrophilum GCM71 = DSM 17998 TaxID=1123057 RepID=U5BYA8_9BACT|nr:hypothetical protein P872_19980 [Rhodonellum psychrophilum GCM71 = DSM 17998]